MKTFLLMTLTLSILGLNGCGKIKHSLRGEQGQHGWQGVPGERGPQGEQEPVGPQGLPGVGCTVTEVAGGSEISCEDGTSAEVMNGINGLDGVDGTGVVTIELCPSVSGGLFKEYLAVIAGEVYGIYASGQKIGLTKLWPGNWTTTDGRTCNFTIGADNTVTF